MLNPFDIYQPVTLENKYFEYDINLSPSQIKEFGKNNIVTLDLKSNKKPFKVFLTNTQIKKVEAAKKLNKEVDLKFSKTQFKKTLPYVTRLNNSLMKQRSKDRLETLKKKNAKKAKKLKKLKLQYQLETLKKKKNSEKKLNKIIFDTFVKNTLKK